MNRRDRLRLRYSSSEIRNLDLWSRGRLERHDIVEWPLPARETDSRRFCSFSTCWIDQASSSEPEYCRSPQGLPSTMQDASTLYGWEDETRRKLHHRCELCETVDACLPLASSSCSLRCVLECFEIDMGGYDVFSGDFSHATLLDKMLLPRHFSFDTHELTTASYRVNLTPKEYASHVCTSGRDIERGSSLVERS